jgi:hypothetical protein
MGNKSICAVLIVMEFAAQIKGCVVRSVSLAMEINAIETNKNMNIHQSVNA